MKNTLLTTASILALGIFVTPAMADTDVSNDTEIEAESSAKTGFFGSIGNFFSGNNDNDYAENDADADASASIETSAGSDTDYDSDSDSDVNAKTGISLDASANVEED